MSLDPIWQPSFDEIELSLIETTFVVIDLETTGGSPRAAHITEIGAVKVRGGEVIGEFQTLVNPGVGIPAFITVLTGITDAMVLTAPPIGEAFFSLLEFIGSPDESVLVAHNAPFDIGFLKAAAISLSVKWPSYQVIDTARIARYALTRDEVPNFKLASLAQHFTAATTPEHRALADARATVDVLHGVLERMGSQGVATLADLRSFTNRVTDAQRGKKHLAQNLPAGPGVYIFRDSSGDALYVGTSRNVKSRVRSYFTAAETRKRMHDMVALANRVDVIETPTVIEAEVRELRMIAANQPRFNRRSRFQEKAIWVRLTDESFPRLAQVRGGATFAAGSGWSGPFNGRDEAQHAIEAIYESFPLRQCSPRITINSMKKASPCALLGLGKCGAPCIGLQSFDSYGSLTEEIKFALHENPTLVSETLLSRMRELSLSERFEEAAAIRDRLGAFVRGAARGQRIASLTSVAELVAARPTGSIWELILIRHGRLAGSLNVTEARMESALAALLSSGETVSDDGSVLPASSHEEVEVLLRYLRSEDLRLLHIKGSWHSPVFGAGHLRAALEGARANSDEQRYKEDFANSFVRSTQR